MTRDADLARLLAHRPAVSAVVAAIAAGRRVVGYGPTAEPAFTARLQAEEDAFTAAAARFPVATYAGQA
jgi:hypothetical protein